MQRRALTASILILFALLSAGAQVYRPARALFTMRTEHFTIIYPDESRRAALYLRSFAEEVFDEVAAKLRVEEFPRIPVMITPDSEDLNGSTSFMPLRITLYQAPISPNSGFALYNDELRKLFLHELAHAVSMSIRAPFWQFLSGVFSDAIIPVAFDMPMSLSEGVTVSFESADGFGRAADTPYAAIIRQDIIEGRFKSFDQAAGAWELYPFGVFYVYGGFFSKYLQATYGMDAYAELWREMGKGRMIAGFKGSWPFKGCFERAYGLKLDAVWKAFGEYMALKVPVATRTYPISDRPDALSAPLASDGRRIYWADSSRVWRYDAETGKRDKLFDYDGTITRISPSPEGRRLLVSSFRITDGYPKDLVRVYDLEGRRWEDAAFPPKLSEAAWLPDGSIVASRNIGYGQDLVRLAGAEEELLFHGTQRFTPAQAYPYGEGGIAFILNIDGANSVARMDLATRRIELLSSAPALKRLRHLYSDGAELAFSFDSDDSLLKLARLGVDGLRVEDAPISGGVQYPVTAGGSVFYAGFFSAGHMVLRYPEGDPALALRSIDSSWESFEPLPSDLASVYDEPEGERAAGTRDADEGRYAALPYLLRPTLWYPSIEANEITGAIGGAGFYAQSADPTGSVSAILEASYLWTSRFAEVRAGLSLASLPLPLILRASDALAPVSDALPFGSRLERSLRGSVELSKAFAFVPATRSLELRLSASAVYGAFGPGDAGEAETSPYGWPLTELRFPFTAGLSYADVVDSPFFANGPKGWTLALGYDGYFEDRPSAPAGLAESALTLRLPWLGFRGSIDAAYATSSGLVLGTAGPLFSDGSAYLGDFSYAAYREFSGINARGDRLYLYQDTGISYTFRTEASLPFDLYLRTASPACGYRSALVDRGYLQSVYVAIAYRFSSCRGMLTYIPVMLRMEYARPLNSELGGRFFIDFGIDL